MFVTRFLSLFLTICLLAASGSAASMRVNEGTGQFAVLCLNGVEQTVELGFNGAPVKPVPHCPDCTTMLGTLPVAPGAISVSDLESALTVRHVLTSQTPVLISVPTARAPPFLIL